MTKRKTSPATKTPRKPSAAAPLPPEPIPAPESVGLSPHEGEQQLGKSRLQQEVDAINSAAERHMAPAERKEIDAKRAALEGSQIAATRRSRAQGATEPPSGTSPSAGKVPKEIKEALARALDVHVLDSPLGLVFKDKDGKTLFHLDQVKNGEFVLRPYWKA
jgi:hypothetical protein